MLIISRFIIAGKDKIITEGILTLYIHPKEGIHVKSSLKVDNASLLVTCTHYIISSIKHAKNSLISSQATVSCLGGAGYKFLILVADRVKNELLNSG